MQKNQTAEPRRNKMEPGHLHHTPEPICLEEKDAILYIPFKEMNYEQIIFSYLGYLNGQGTD